MELGKKANGLFRFHEDVSSLTPLLAVTHLQCSFEMGDFESSEQAADQHAQAQTMCRKCGKLAPACRLYGKSERDIILLLRRLPAWCFVTTCLSSQLTEYLSAHRLFFFISIQKRLKVESWHCINPPARKY